LLFQLTTSSILIAKMFKQYAGNGPMSSDAWRAFIHAEQLGGAVDQSIANDASPEEAAMDLLQDRVSQVEIALGINQFASRLLCPQNNAVLGSLEASDESQNPLAHFWCASSHNSSSWATSSPVKARQMLIDASCCRDAGMLKSIYGTAPKKGRL